MGEVVLSDSTHPRNPIQGAPRMIVYDPGKYIHNPLVQLNPFGDFAEVYYDKEIFLYQISNTHDQQLFLLLVFRTETDVEVRRFLMKYIPDQSHLHSLFLIFHNGLKSHDEYINTQSMRKLQWCRSFTFKLFGDIREACRSACDASITYFDQRMILAEDALRQNSTDAAKSLVALFAAEKKKGSLLVSSYLLTYS